MRKRRSKASDKKAVKRLARAKRTPTVRLDLSRLRAASVLQRLLVLEPNADQTSPEYQKAIRFLDDSLFVVGQRDMSRVKLADRSPAERADIGLLVKYSFQKFVESGHRRWSWTNVGGPLQLEKVEIHPWPTGGVRMMFDGPWPTGFWLSVASALELAGDLLQRCRGCGRMFVKAGKRTYHSRQCGQRLRSARSYRKNRKRILEQRHDKYAAKVREKHPTEFGKVRVRRRPRIV